MSLSPQVCKKNYKVHIPSLGEECEFWLVRVTDEQSITNPDKDHAYYTDDGKLFIYDGKNLVRVNCDICFTQDERDKLEGIQEGANNYTLPEADTNVLGGVKLGYTQNDRNYPVLKDENGNIYVAVPWTEFNLQTAGPDTLGGIKTGYQEQGKNYAVETDVDGNAYVNVPWTDTDTEYNVVSTTENGLAPMLPSENADTKYLRGDGTWQEVNNGSDVLNRVYPVGSIYLSLNSTNPSELFGGTWEQFAQGRTLIGVGELNDGSTLKSFEVGATGGEFEHILSVDEMPQHGHSGLFVNQTRIGWKDSVFQTNLSGQAGIRVDSEYDIRTGDSGANSPHNIMQPYLAVYMFKRVS